MQGWGQEGVARREEADDSNSPAPPAASSKSLEGRVQCDAETHESPGEGWPCLG